MDWDKLKVFHAAAEAGSFTHAGEQLGLSQSAVSRQVSALEQELAVSLFHRHARGLMLTEQGDLLFRTAHDVFMKLEAARAKLTDSRERPNGDLRVTTTPGIGVHWLTPRLGEFIDLYPEVRITLLTTEEELDLAMREADVAIRLRQPTQPDLIQRKLFSVHFHVYASPEYLKRFGTPRTFEDLDSHRVLVLGGNVPIICSARSTSTEVARNGKGPRTPHLDHQQYSRHSARLPARPRHRHAAGLPGRGRRRARATFLRRRSDRARRLLRLSGRTQIRRTRPGVSGFSRRQRATLEPLASGIARASARRENSATRNDVLHGWHVTRRVVRRGSPLHISLIAARRSCLGSSQISNGVVQFLPLWKVIAGAPTLANLRTGPARGPVFLCVEYFATKQVFRSKNMRERFGRIVPCEAKPSR